MIFHQNVERKKLIYMYAILDALWPFLNSEGTDIRAPNHAYENP